MPASAPESPWIEPAPKGEVLDPTIHAWVIVKMHALDVSWDPGDIPPAESNLCGFAWSTQLGCFDLPWRCTIEVGVDGTHPGHHEARDGLGDCHAVAADLRLCA